MCPPAQPSIADLGLYWSDDEIFSLLGKYPQGSCLPNNVLTEASPYQYPPSNLPEGIWYLVHSNEKKESVYGFWRAKGEARKIYTNHVISGWRTTLEYFEGQAPDGQRTDWLMQEYTITKNEFYDKDKPKDSKSLCRVFLNGSHGSKPGVSSFDSKIVIEPKEIDSAQSFVPHDNITSVQECGSKSKEKGTTEMGFLQNTDEKQTSCKVALSDLECLLRGDYLELNDLEDPESHSSSQQNSSCTSNLSDEYFDSLALLRDLEEEDNKYTQEKQSNSRYSFMTSVRPNDLVVQPDASGSVMAVSRCTTVDESPQTCSTFKEQLPDTRVLDHSTKRQKPERRGEETSSSSDAASSSPDQKNEMRNREKKPGSGKRKKLKLCFCFSPF